MDLIPSIDLLEGRVVRLRKGDYDDVTVYHEDAVALAASWSGRARLLHVVDLEGARDGTAAQRELVRRVADAFAGDVQVGGGVRSMDSVRAWLDAGIARVVLGTAAVRDPELVRAAAREYPERVVIAVDARGGLVATDGWREQSTRRAVDVVREFADAPLAAVLYTDIDRDGMESGPNIAETARLGREGGVPVIASGGVGTLDHLRSLAGSGITAAIVGRALHEGRFTLEEARVAAGAE